MKNWFEDCFPMQDWKISLAASLSRMLSSPPYSRDVNDWEFPSTKSPPLSLPAEDCCWKNHFLYSINFLPSRESDEEKVFIFESLFARAGSVYTFK